MADRSNFFIMQLFHEMKQRFPAIPDRVVSECIRQNFNDKQICEAVLKVKNRNYSHRLFPSPHMSKMLPASSNEGGSTVGDIEASTNESETESSRYDDDDACVTSGSSAISEAEESESHKVVQKRVESVTGAVAASQDPVPQRTSTSSAKEELYTPGNKTEKMYSEAFQVPSNFRPQLLQEGCGRGIGGGCCCRHAEDMDFLREYEDVGGMVNVGEQAPICSSVLPPTDNNLVIDGLGDSDFFHDKDVKKSTPVTKYSSYLGGPPLMSVSVPGVRPPPTHMPNVADLSTQTLNLNLSTSELGSEFEHFNQERKSQEMHDFGFGPSRSEMPHTEPLSPSYKPPYTYDPNIGFVEHGFMDEPHGLSHDEEDFLFNVNYSLRTTAGASNFQDGEEEARVDISGKGQTTTSSTVKVSASSPVSSPLNRRQANLPGLQPTPVFAGQSRFQSTKDSPPSMGMPTTPTNYPNTSASPTSSQLIETPLSYTTVNLRVRQPSSDPLPPIDIRSSVGDSSRTSSYYPQQSFQSELQIRIGGAGISSGSGYGPITSSWKSQPPPPSGKNLSPNPSPTSQMRPQNQNSKLHSPTNRTGEQQHHSPLPTRREQAERLHSLYRPLSPGNLGTALHTSGSLSDVSKARLFDGEHDRNHGTSGRQMRVQHQLDPRIHPNSSIPSSSGLPPHGPSTSQSSRDKGRMPRTAPSSSPIDHPQTTCPDVSRCKALLMHQIERKNLLEKELNKEREKLKSMQEEARMMESDLRQRQMRQRSHATLPIIQRVHTLRQEIQVLQEECKKMTNEVDLHSDIQVPLGETDEEFYKNIYTGQRGWVLLPPLNAQSHASQRAENLHQHGREPRGRHRNDPTSPGMNIPRHIPGERMGEGAGEGLGLGPGLGGEGPNWTCSVCTFRNHPALDKCEQCEMPRIMLGMPSGGSLVPKSPCFCHPNNDIPLRPTCNLPPGLLPVSYAPSPSSLQVVSSPTNLDASSNQNGSSSLLALK